MSKNEQVRFSVAVLVCLSFIAVGFTSLIPVNATSATLNNVQVFVQTTSTNLNSYSLIAYNSSGYLVASSTSTYAAFGLELPSGTYLITVTATQEGSYYPIAYSSGVGTASLPANSSNIIISPPIKVPLTEYGYVLQTVSGPITLNIKTAPITTVPTTKIHVGVSYVNGTSVSGAWVYSSVVGGYYDGVNTKTVMENQTVAGGSTTLIVPNLPILLNGYISLPVNAPKTTTTTTTTIGGQPLNVTIYWQPNYVELSGTALVIPPQTTAQITLSLQQSSYIIEPYTSAGVQSGVVSTTTSAALTEVPSGTVGNSTTPTQIPPFEAQLAGTSNTSTISTGPAQTNLLLVGSAGLIIALAIVGVALFRVRKPRASL